MKKIILLLILVLTGCYNYQDINDLAIIESISINKTGNQYELSMEVINTNKDNKENTIYKTVGTSIDDTFNNIDKIIPKDITYDHLKIIMINSDMQEDFTKLVNYLFQEKHINDDIYLLINNKDKIDTNYLLGILKKNKVKTLYDILNNYLNNSILNIPNIDKDIYES